MKKSSKKLVSNDDIYKALIELLSEIILKSTNEKNKD